MTTKLRLLYDYSDAEIEELPDEASSTLAFDDLERCQYCVSLLSLIDSPYHHYSGTEDLKFCRDCGWWIYQYFHQVMGGEASWHVIRGILQKFDIGSTDIPCTILRDYLARNYSDIENIHPRKLEELVASIFREHLHCDVEMTKQTRDGGYDLVAINAEKQKMLVEVKRYRSDRKVGVSIVRAMFGTLMLNDVSHGVIVSTSDFSSESREAVTAIKKTRCSNFQLELKDARDLYEWLHALYKPGEYIASNLANEGGLHNLLIRARSNWE